MKPKPVSFSKLHNRIARQTARLASLATSDAIHGGARALVLARKADKLGAKFSDGVSAREIVSDVYSRSTGKPSERFGAYECPECGCACLGLEMALACCAETEVEADIIDGELDGQNLDGFASAEELLEHGEEMEAKGAPSVYCLYCQRKADAMELRARGDIACAVELERECEKLYRRMPDAWKW